MLKVGIYVDYVRGETALAATMLADWLTRLGFGVVLMSDGVVQRGIHPYWDNHVRRALKRNDVCAWAYGCTHICWFTPSLFAMEAAYVVAPDSVKRKMRHFYFPSWGSWMQLDEEFLMLVDRVICLSRDMASWLDHKYPTLAVPRTHHLLASPTQVTQGRYGRTQRDSTSLLVVLPRTIDIDLDIDFLEIFSELMDWHPHLYVSFLPERSMLKDYRRHMQRTIIRFQHRAQLLPVSNYSDYARIAREHDWVYLASTRHKYGSLLASLLPGTSPVITSNLPPAPRYISDTTSGLLVGCDTIEHPYPIAEVDKSATHSILDKLFMAPETTLRGMQAVALSSFQRKQRLFSEFLHQEFMA